MTSTLAVPSKAPATASSSRPGRTRPTTNAEILRWALLGTIALLCLVMIDVHRYGGDNPVSLIQPGQKGSATALFTKDFPTLEQPPGSGLDGQLYYAIARDPIHLNETARYLDGPRYRLQRPLLPWLAWVLHPTGGGNGLVFALFTICLAGSILGALATGWLSRRWGGPAWVALLFPLLPGAWWSLRVTVSDALALALALTAIALAEQRKLGGAVAVGALAVLAKEPAILVLGGWWLAHRSRRNFSVVAVPAAVALAWMVWLRLHVPAVSASSTQDITVPGRGLVQAWHEVWGLGNERVGMACTLAGLAIGLLALIWRGLRHPLGWAIAVQLLFMLSMGLNPTAMTFGATRMAMPVTVLSILALATPNARRTGPGPSVSGEWTGEHLGTDSTDVPVLVGHRVPT